MVTTIGAAATMFAVAEADIAGFAVDLAVMVTVLPGDAEESATKVAASPLDVCGVIPPQEVVPQLNDQSAPACEESLSTTATTCAVWAEPSG